MAVSEKTIVRRSAFYGTLGKAMASQARSGMSVSLPTLRNALVRMKDMTAPSLLSAAQQDTWAKAYVALRTLKNLGFATEDSDDIIGIILECAQEASTGGDVPALVARKVQELGLTAVYY